MASTYAIEKFRAFLHAVAGVLLIVCAMRVGPWLASFLLGLGGVWMTGRAFTRMIRIWAREQRLLASARHAYGEFNRATLPRQVFWLLFAVAEADGRPEAAERELVRRFLLERFVDPFTHADLQNWEAQRIPPEQVGVLAASLRHVLSRAECETIFFWCCLITFVDRAFKTDEHAALHRVARGLGIAPAYARVLFHQAKARFLGSEPRATWGREGGSRQAPRAWPPTERERALAVLGLASGATREQIRRRHRELVKRFHPDAHSHLGPIAADEATKRFREIQAAYELLGAGRGDGRGAG